MLTQHRVERCFSRARSALENNPLLSYESSKRLLHDNVLTEESLSLHYQACLRLEKFSQAQTALEKLINIAPDNLDVHRDLIRTAMALADYSAVERLIEPLQSFSTKDEAWLLVMINALNCLGRHRESLQHHLRLAELKPDNAGYRVMLAKHYQTLGEMGLAETAFRQAIELDPDNASAYYFFSSLRKVKDSDNNLEAMSQFLERHPDVHDNCEEIHAAMGKEYEDIKHFDLAFKHYQFSNAIMARRSVYSPVMDERVFASVRHWYQAIDNKTCENNTSESNVNHPKGLTPIFVLGMPRTGSTLIDRILSSHSKIRSAGELQSFRMATQECCGDERGDFFDHFLENPKASVDFQAIGEKYLQKITPVTGDSGYFIDKMPMNYVFVGLIAKALPQAKFIHSVRNPMDTCFSNFKQMFGIGYYNYSLKLEDTAHHFCLYRELMDYWHQQLPGRILDVKYEDVIDSNRVQIERMLSYLDLDWEENCIDFHLNKHSVNTASVSQVRQPLYRSSVEKWRMFSGKLQTLKLILEKGGFCLD